MELITEVSCGDWLRARVGDWAHVGGVAGAGFEAYARILHPVPVHREDLTVTDRWGMHPVLEEARWPWSRVAARQGLAMHPLVQWNRLADLDQGVDFADGWRVGQTREGFLDVDLLAGLAGHLRQATGTPDELVVGIWSGWGELTGSTSVYTLLESTDSGLEDTDDAAEAAMRRHLEERRTAVAPDVAAAVRRGPLLELPDREYVLLATDCDELTDEWWPRRAGIGWTSVFEGPLPQLVWPADQAWVVASEIDWDSTIVAGPRALVDAVVADDRFEAFEVDQDGDLTWEGDLINPPRAGWSAGS